MEALDIHGRLDIHGSVSCYFIGRQTLDIHASISKIVLKIHQKREHFPKKETDGQNDYVCKPAAAAVTAFIHLLQLDMQGTRYSWTLDIHGSNILFFCHLTRYSWKVDIHGKITVYDLS